MTDVRSGDWLTGALVAGLLATGCAGAPAPIAEDGSPASDPAPVLPTPAADVKLSDPPAVQPTPAVEAAPTDPPAEPPPAADGLEPERFDKFSPENAWHVVPMTERGNDGKRYVMRCPPGQSSPMRGGYGTDVYADASPVCLAAVHVGVISAADGGDVVFEMRPGQGSYAGSERNGLTTLDYGEWDGSFVIVSGAP